jgi:hypothetical protein
MTFFLLSWATLGYLGLAWASMLTGTHSSERVRARFSIFTRERSSKGLLFTLLLLFFFLLLLLLLG